KDGRVKDEMRKAVEIAGAEDAVEIPEAEGGDHARPKGAAAERKAGGESGQRKNQAHFLPSWVFSPRATRCRNKPWAIPARRSADNARGSGPPVPGRCNKQPNQ